MLQSMRWSGEHGSELELTAAAAQPVPQVQNMLCLWGNLVRLRFENNT